MIDAAYVQRMARYNRWQNQNLYGVADALPDDERRRERGAFFGSIHKTLSHLLWADRIWMSRFASTARSCTVGIPQSVRSLSRLGAAQARACGLRRDDHRLGRPARRPVARRRSDVVYSGGAQRELTKPKWLLVTHLFNHQTHHRGQVHCMLTQAGGKPHDTDLPLMAE